jgi:O-antigen/teichoic acid export membrane protein
MTLKKQAVSGVFWTTIQQFGKQGIAFFTSLILARLLSPQEFGLIAMISVFIALGDGVIKSGLTNSLIRSENLGESDYSTVFYFNLFGSFIVYGLLYFSAPFIAAFYNQSRLTEIIQVYGIIFILNAFSAVQLARLTKQMDFKTQMIVALPSIIISSAVGIYMAYNGYGVWSLVWNSLIQSGLSTIQLWYHSKWIPIFKFSTEKFKYHFNYGFKIMLSGTIDILFTNIYAIIIGRYFIPAQVGFYNRASTLQMFPVVNFSMILSKVSFPLFAKIQHDNEKLKSVYKKLMQMVTFLIAPTLIFMGVLAEPLFRFLFTEKWLPAVPYFQILCYNGILYPLHSYNLQILNVKGRSDLFLKLELIKKVIVVIMLVISFQFGIFGLLIGSTITSTIAFFLNNYYSGKYIGYNAFEQLKDVLPIVIIAAFSGSIIYLTDTYVFKPNLIDFLRLLLNSLIGLILFIILSYYLKIQALTEFKNILQKK